MSSGERWFIILYVSFQAIFIYRSPRLESLSWNVGKGKPLKKTEVRDGFMQTGTPKMLYILIRYPTQTNIKHLSCNKQPQLGCVNTSRVRPSLLCLHKQNGWKQYNKQNENSEMHKITARKTIQQNDLNYARITINQIQKIQNVLNFSCSSMQKTTCKRSP